MSGITLRELMPLLMVVAVIGSNSLSLGPIAPGIAAELNASIEAVLYGSAGYGLGTGLAALSLARWIDRFGAVPMLRITCLVLVLAFAACAMASGVTVLVLMQTAAGLAAGVALPAVYAQAAFISPSGHESRVLGRVLLGWTLGMVGGVSVAAFLADFFGWRSVYAALALLSLLVLLQFHRVTGDLPMISADRSEKAKPVAAAAKPSMLAAFRVPGVPRLLLMVALYMMSFYGVYGYVGDHVVQSLQLPLSANAWVVVAYGCGFGLAALLDAQIDRFNPVVATPAALLLLAMVYLALFISNSFVVLVLLAFFWGLMNHLAINVLIARLSAADPKQRGAVLGLYSGITYLSMSIATLLAGLMYARTGWSALNLVAAGLCVSATLLAYPKARAHTVG